MEHLWIRLSLPSGGDISWADYLNETNEDNLLKVWCRYIKSLISLRSALSVVLSSMFHCVKTSSFVVLELVDNADVFALIRVLEQVQYKAQIHERKCDKLNSEYVVRTIGTGGVDTPAVNVIWI